MLPRVKIYFENGALGSVAPSEDGVVGLVVTAQSGSVYKNNIPHLITKLADLLALGVTEVDSPLLYKTVSDFYTEAASGAKLWFMGVNAGIGLSQMVDPAHEYAKKLIDYSNGAVNILIADCDSSTLEVTYENGLDADVYAALDKAQALGVWAADVKFAPIFTLLAGCGYTGNATQLQNIHLGSHNRVGIVIGDTESGSSNAAVGLLAGRLASIPVQRSIARVKNGAIKTNKIYIGDVLAENGSPDLIHDAGFITMRTLVGKAGYFFSDDKLATAQTDDYALIPRRRVIDKAYRIAYKVLIEELGEEIPGTATGGIPAVICKHIQNAVEVAIENNMTAEGNLGVDPNNAQDTGVQCYVDPAQNVVSTSTLAVRLRVKPFGYAKYIDLYLGFKTVAN